jgi:hypothetical protein
MQSRFKTRSLRASNSGTFRIRRQVVQQEEAEAPLQQATPGNANASVIVRGNGTTEIVIEIVIEIAGDHARHLRQAGTTPTGAIRSDSKAKVRRGRRCDRIHQTESGTQRRLLLRCTGVPNNGRRLKRPAGSRTGSATGCYCSSLAGATATGPGAAAGATAGATAAVCVRVPETAIARQRMRCRSFEIRLSGPNPPWLASMPCHESRNAIGAFLLPPSCLHEHSACSFGSVSPATATMGGALKATP